MKINLNWKLRLCLVEIEIKAIETESSADMARLIKANEWKVIEGKVWFIIIFLVNSIRSQRGGKYLPKKQKKIIIKLKIRYQI